MTMFSRATLRGAFTRLVMPIGAMHGPAEADCSHGGTRAAGRSQNMTVGQRMMLRHSRVPLVAAIVLPGAAVAFLGLVVDRASTSAASHSSANIRVPMGASQANAQVTAPGMMEIVPARLGDPDAGLFVGTGDQSNGSWILR